MRDYADYFNDRKQPEKRGVTIQHDIDWWMERITGYMAKLLFIIILALLALVLKSFFQVGKSRVFFPIENITVNGDVLITQPQDINAALAKITEKSFFTVSLDLVSERLTSLPWVKSAIITRHWPNKLSVNIIERQAAYRWGDNELIDAQGNRFANTNNNLFSHLPKLSGVDGFEKEVINTHKSLMKHLGVSAERLDIDQLVLNQYLSWELHLKSGIVIKFGRDEYAKRIIRFAEVFQANKLPDQELFNVLDFRYNRGFAVKWRPEFAPQTRNGKLMKVNEGQTTGI